MTLEEKTQAHFEMTKNEGYLLAILDLQATMKELHKNGVLTLDQSIAIESQMFASLEVQKLNKFTPNLDDK